jgi:hypothetical protein
MEVFEKVPTQACRAQRSIHCMTARDSIGNPFASLESRMRYSALVAAILCAVLSEALSFAGREVGVIMGRATMLLGPVALAVHMLMAILYGAVLAVAIGRARGSVAWIRAFGATAFLYFANAWVSASFFAPRLSAETEAVFAHGLFAIAFICIYKASEEDAPAIPIRSHTAH